MEAYGDHAHFLHPHNPSSHTLTPYDTTVLAVDIFQKVEDDLSSEGLPASRQGGAGGGGQKTKFSINAAVELTACWIRDVFDE